MNDSTGVPAARTGDDRPLLDRARALPGVEPVELSDAQLDAVFDDLLAKLSRDLDIDNRLPDGRRR